MLDNIASLRPLVCAIIVNAALDAEAVATGRGLNQFDGDLASRNKTANVSYHRYMLKRWIGSDQFRDFFDYLDIPYQDAEHIFSDILSQKRSAKELVRIASRAIAATQVEQKRWDKRLEKFLDQKEFEAKLERKRAQRRAYKARVRARRRALKNANQTM